MYVLVNNGEVKKYQYSAGELRKDNPNTSFPRKFSDELLAKWGVFPVILTNQPEYDQLTHSIHEGQPEFIDDLWYQTWVINSISQEEIDIRKENQSKVVRQERDQKLQDSDGIVALSYEKSEQIPIEWSSYRQNLRYIPQQDGFPWNIQWPDRTID